MYNFHCHSLLSDGMLLPSEVAVLYMAAGYKAIAITDHVDYSNIKLVVEQTIGFCRHWPKSCGIEVLPGVEITHVLPEQFLLLVKYARSKGIKIIVGHGETTAETVIRGTNRAALEAGVDILAHPGLISDADVKLAKKKGVFLELTSRAGHSDTNRHVAASAKKFGAKLILSTDSHTPEDIITPNQLLNFARKSAGLIPDEIKKIDG